MGSGCNISGAFSSDTTISTPVAINKGGTGETTAQAALDALAAASGSLVQGDVFIVDASGNVVRLARGSDNQTMVMNGNNPNWETVSGGATTNNNSITGSTNNQTTTSTSLVDMSGTSSATLSNQSGGLAICNLSVNMESDTAQAPRIIGVYYNSDDQERTASSAPDADKYDALCIGFNDATDGGTIQMRWATGSGTLTSGNGGNQQSNCTISEVY